MKSPDRTSDARLHFLIVALTALMQIINVYLLTRLKIRARYLGAHSYA